MRGISQLDENRSASQEGLCSMEWVSKVPRKTNNYSGNKPDLVRCYKASAPLPVTLYMNTCTQEQNFEALFEKFYECTEYSQM